MKIIKCNNKNDVSILVYLQILNDKCNNNFIVLGNVYTFIFFTFVKFQ